VYETIRLEKVVVDENYYKRQVLIMNFS